MNLEAVGAALARRRPGSSALSSPRQESDAVELLAGLGGYERVGRNRLIRVLFVPFNGTGGRINVP